MIGIAIMGYGVVGSGVAQVLCDNAESIASKAGDGIKVRRILDLREFPNDPLAGCFTKSFEDIINDAEIRVVVETMGGLHPAYEYVKACLEQGKSVVTSNKELVAAKGDELLRLAKENNLNFLFEASVGGGIPILRPLDQCLAANEVTDIAGILNGTTNFMLNRMITEGETFEEALALAQQLGYAERNPHADVAGVDACRKICILASLAFGKHVHPDGVYTEGIEAITLEDVRYAAKAGGVIKLIGRAHKAEDGKVFCMVAPMLVKQTSMLAHVDDVFNAVMVRGNAVGDVMFYGRGAGKLPTASAVVADVIDAVKHFKARKYLFWESAVSDYLKSFAEWECERFVRFSCDTAAQKDAVLAAFEDGTVITDADLPQNEVVLLLPCMSECALEERVAALGVPMAASLRVVDF